jgi:hypothetical protein
MDDLCQVVDGGTTVYFDIKDASSCDNTERYTGDGLAPEDWTCKPNSGPTVSVELKACVVFILPDAT